MASAAPTPQHVVPPPQPANAEGFDRIGDYELLELIGQGGMGRVFRARQVSLERIVALKILPPALARNHTYTLRFLREARASGKLIHPHVVQGIDFGQDEGSGLWYFAMEYVDGFSLADELKRSRALPESRVIEIGIAIASALEVAEKHGIVHRDIKPENILVSHAGDIKLADLGVAKLSQGEDASLTGADDMVGTPYYVAPEQARGKRDQIDTRTDLYSLGATLFHLVTGQPPYEGETCADIMVKHIQDKVPLAHRVDEKIGEPFSRVIAKMMQKQPAQRYQSPAEAREALERAKLGFFSGRGGTTRAVAVGRRTSSAKMVLDRNVTSMFRYQADPSLPSQRYLFYGVGAILVSLLPLVYFLIPDHPGDAGGPSHHEPTPSFPEPIVPAQVAVTAPTHPPPEVEPDHGLDGWSHADLGKVEVPGSVVVDGEAITITASGADIWGPSDEGFVVYRCMRGDAVLTARIKSIQETDPWSKVGVMFRESLDGDARNVFQGISAEACNMLTSRTKRAGDTRSVRGPSVSLPAWIRLVRQENTFTGFVSKDGINWKRVSSVCMTLNRDLYVCLAVTSHQSDQTTTVVVDSLEAQGTFTPGG